MQRLLTARAASPTGIDPSADPSASQPSCSQLRVLVADDNPVNLMLTSELLSCWGITPLLAADGVQAVRLANTVRLHLILMDLQMPVLDGLAATRRIRSNERRQAQPRVPVVAYTSSVPTPGLLRDSGFDDLLDKPCEPQALRACLLRWCPLTHGILT